MTLSRSPSVARAWAFCLGCMVFFAAYAQPVVVPDWRYTIRPQDTVSALTQQYLKPTISWKVLADYNRLPDANVIHAGAQLRIPLRWLAIKQAQARLMLFSGNVQVQSLDGSWHPAQDGQSLQAGQRVQVGQNSSARLQFADASELVMQPHSLVVLDTLSLYAGGYMVDTQLRLQTGRVEVNANPLGRKGQKFEVITPGAVASVRGTQFVVEADASRTIELTTEGQVALQTQQGGVLVTEGYVSSASAGEKPQSPEVIKPAPVLQNPVTKFTDFPIAFSLQAQSDVSGWVMQVGQDPHMAQLVLSQKFMRPLMNAGGLANGRHYLRTWSLDGKGIPSHVAQHAFEVDIPRQLQGPAIQLLPDYFAAGPVALELAALAPGQRYLVQMTLDKEGRLPVWYMFNAKASLTLPVPEQPDRLHHLWIWVY